jgi:hypothetical protein
MITPYDIAAIMCDRQIVLSIHLTSHKIFRVRDNFLNKFSKISNFETVMNNI